MFKVIVRCDMCGTEHKFTVTKDELKPKNHSVTIYPDWEDVQNVNTSDREREDGQN
jgi:hypothetical protein